MLENIVMDYTIIAVVKKLKLQLKKYILWQGSVCIINNYTPCSSLVLEKKEENNIILFSHCTGQTDCVSLINNFLSVEDLEYYTKPQGI